MKIKNILSGAINLAVAGIIISAGVMASSRAAASRAEAIECMALNIYHEARGEETEGQIAVAHVVMNRVNHSYFPNDICDVVYQNRQFSWTQDGLSDTAHDREAYRYAESIARSVINNEVDDPTDGALFYHARWVRPSWARRMDHSVSIGVHHFYTWDGNWNND